MDSGASSYRRYLDGDDDGFVCIINDYMDGLRFYLSSIVGNIFVAEDLTEDTFVKIITKKPRFSGKSSFKTWLYTIGRNIALDYLKKTKQGTIPIDEISDISDDEAILEKEYIRKEDKILIHRALRRLKPEYHQILWLIYFENFTNKEASVIMKKSVHTSANLTRIRQQFSRNTILRERSPMRLSSRCLWRKIRVQR